jgi:hypothetical protein
LLSIETLLVICVKTIVNRPTLEKEQSVKKPFNLDL